MTQLVQTIVLGLLIGGAIINEHNFYLHGPGVFTHEALPKQALPEIMGATLLDAFFIVIAHLVEDVLYQVVDPRVRH